MMYIVHYFDDDNKKHIFVAKSLTDVKFLQERFGEVTIESYAIN